MASWAGNRRLIYVLIAVLIIIAVIAVPIFIWLNRPPTCTDGIQNQNEEGVDCGGSCLSVCQVGNTGIVVDWARPFQVDKGIYDIGALVENTNERIGSSQSVYHFKMCDANNVLIAERFGKTFVLPGSKWVIFEGNIETGERIPRHASIEFSDNMSWVQADKTDPSIPDIGVRDQIFSERDGKPRLTVTIVNRSPFPVKNIEVVALLSNTEDTAVGVSRTIIEQLEKYGSAEVVFTWRTPFDIPPAKIDIIPRVNYIKTPVTQ